MSCGQIALNQLGINIGCYYAAEIKDIAIKVTKHNYPNTIHIGDVNNVSYKDGILYTENGNFKVGKIDLVIFGSPCQSFSIAMKTEHRIGIKDKQKSGLFLECFRILKEVNPTYFLMENVASMRNEDKDFITKLMGVEPIRINSSVVSPALRDRYYWTNIPQNKEIKKNDISLNEVIDYGYTDRKKARCLTVADSRPLTSPSKMFHRYYSTGFTTLIFSDEEHYKKCKDYYDNHYKGLKGVDIPKHETSVFEGVRYLNQNELERCQTVPQGYTRCLTRNEAADVLGDGWTIKVIVHLFSSLKDIYK